MRIAVDGNEANVEKKVGVSVYAFELLEYFWKKASPNLTFLVYLRENPRDNLPRENKHFFYRVVQGPFMWSQFFLPMRLYKDGDFDIFFSPAHYTPRFCPSPLVVTIHDLSYLYYPDEFLKQDLYKLINWTKRSLAVSKKAIAVSNYTKEDITKNYNIKENKVEVVYNGFRRLPTSGSLSKSLPSRYLLYVGTLQPRKNLITLFEAFAQVKKQHKTLKLVVVGKKGWLYEEIFKRVHSLKLDSEIVFTGYVTENELAQMYKKAEALVIPSLYEGFGLPILEAMSLDCPVIASNTSALPEIGGEAAVYFDPHDTIEMTRKIAHVLSDRSEREDLIKKGRRRIKTFGWDKCGSQTLDVLRKVGHENSTHG